jgi:hypothetical protein
LVFRYRESQSVSGSANLFGSKTLVNRNKS